MQADRYIPVHYDEIVEHLAADLFEGEERRRFQSFAWLLENFVEYEHAEREESLKKKYFFFSPDDDTLTRRRPTPEELAGLKAEFLAELDDLFDSANFERIDRKDFEKAMREGTSEGLKILVNLDEYEVFLIYYRGLATSPHTYRNWRTLFRSRVRQQDLYMRAATVTKLASGKHIYLKLFKDIPVQDIESLLPQSRVKMKLLDKVKMGGATGAAVLTAVRTTIKGAMFLGKSFFIPLLLGVAALYMGKTVLSFFQMRDRYRTRIIKDLFYQNLDNNLGVINRMIDSAEEEDATEAVLAYAYAVLGAEDQAAIKAKVEAFLDQGWDAAVDFEVEDALTRLAARGLVFRDGDRVTAVPLARALEILDRRWDEIFTPK